MATKLEAFLGRGKNDPLTSQDIEDILILFDGREEIVAEIQASPEALQEYIHQQLNALFKHNAFEHAIAAASQGDTGREGLIFQRLQKLCSA